MQQMVVLLFYPRTRITSGQQELERNVYRPDEEIPSHGGEITSSFLHVTFLSSGHLHVRGWLAATTKVDGRF